MSKAYEYKIVSGTQEDVEKGVTELSMSGWQLHGNLTVIPAINRISNTFAQTMIKECYSPGAWG